MASRPIASKDRPLWMPYRRIADPCPSDPWLSRVTSESRHELQLILAMPISKFARAHEPNIRPTAGDCTSTATNSRLLYSAQQATQTDADPSHALRCSTAGPDSCTGVREHITLKRHRYSRGCEAPQVLYLQFSRCEDKGT